MIDMEKQIKDLRKEFKLKSTDTNKIISMNDYGLFSFPKENKTKVSTVGLGGCTAIIVGYEYENKNYVFISHFGCMFKEVVENSNVIKQRLHNDIFINSEIKFCKIFHSGITNSIDFLKCSLLMCRRDLQIETIEYNLIDELTVHLPEFYIQKEIKLFKYGKF